MAEPEKNIQEIQAVIKAVSGHPEVNIDQAAEIMALTNEKLELARSLQSLQDFSAIEIEKLSNQLDAFSVLVCFQKLVQCPALSACLFNFLPGSA